MFGAFDSKPKFSRQNLSLIKKPFLAKDDLKNYIPVSGLSLISKVVEHIVASQLKSHLAANNLVNINQSAYKTGHSTETLHC